MPRMKEWLFVNGVGAPQLPEPNTEVGEFEQTRLFGRVYDDPRNVGAIDGAFESGHRIITSPIQEVNWDERTARTRSGSIYHLEGYPKEEYMEWLKEAGHLEKVAGDLFRNAN